MRRVEARGAEEDEPEGVEGADVGSQEAVCGKCNDDIAGEDTAEWEAAAWSRFGLI